MGDYLNSGEKIGTCGDAYYATLSMLQKLTNEPEAQYYCEPKNGCSFAFPFPAYDNKTVGNISNFHEGERIDYFFDLPSTFESHHKEISFHTHPKGGEGVNLFINCPHDGGNVSRNFKKDNVTYRLINQVYYKGELCIAAECIYCGSKNIFSKDEAMVICELIEAKKYSTHEDKEYNFEISRRIKSTYNILETVS